jgi:hypothetical protein
VTPAFPAQRSNTRVLKTLMTHCITWCNTEVNGRRYSGVDLANMNS